MSELHPDARAMPFQEGDLVRVTVVVEGRLSWHGGNLIEIHAGKDDPNEVFPVRIQSTRLVDHPEFKIEHSLERLKKKDS